MKYYIYVSDTKVDMLYSQIPKPLLKKIASSLSIDLKLLGAEINIGAKSGQSDETRYSKVKVVSEYIKKHLDVGSMDVPSTYFKGSLPMQWGNWSNMSVAYFAGLTNRTYLGLGGSLKHVIGIESIPQINGRGGSILSSLYDFLQSEEKGILGDDEEGVLISVALMTQNKNKPKQQFEFLAKTLLQGPLGSLKQQYGLQSSRSYAVLGTPIYVAIAD